MNKERKNIFLLDGPIGRKDFLIFLALLFIYIFLFRALMVAIAAFVGVNVYSKYILRILLIIYVLLLSYLKIVNYSKRLFDIIGDSIWKSFLYIILIQVASIAMAYIPILKYIYQYGILDIILLICLSTIKGKYNNDNKNNDLVIEAQCIENNSNQ